MAIESYRALIEKELSVFITQMGEKNGLRDACEYALTNGGKRLRPILVLMIANALQKNCNVMPAALSVEFFHTASLIADDLPCMDNADFRRDRPSLHKVFGENVAILASYALIAEGYGGIYKNGQENSLAAVLCLEAATRCAGINGATNGQFLDLFPPHLNLETAQKIIYQKTITLFEICFVFGWLFGGGAVGRLPDAKKCAYHLGMAFQIADDLLDEGQDGASINIVHVCGKERARQLFENETEQFIFFLRALKLYNDEFQEIVTWLWQYSIPALPQQVF